VYPATVSYPITLDRAQELAAFSKKGGLARSPVEKLRDVRDERRRMAKAMEPGAALESLFGDEQRWLIAEVAELFGQTYESLVQSLAADIKNVMGFATADPDRRLQTELEEGVRRHKESGSTGGRASHWGSQQQPPVPRRVEEPGQVNQGCRQEAKVACRQSWNR
jgi:hypothetical protein